MSIETSGPQGYEYQYLVSLLITLRVIHNENIEVLIENQDGEDAQIKYIKNGKEEIIDIQVKKRSQPIEIDEYCKWISHFENRNFRSNLLTKLKKDKNRIAIFITNQRCKDEVSIFLSENEEIRQLSKPINSKKISSIKSYILSVYQKKIGIEKKRRLFLKDFLKDISNEELKNVLRRMIIFTQYKEENVEFEIKTILNSKFNITQNCLNNVILELLEVIKKGRDTKQNIVSDIYDRLEKSKGEKIFHYDKFYFKRDKVKKCIDILNEENVLLLTGISQCGKTYVAQDIAQKFQDSGYNIERTYDYNEAISFLKRSISDDRLCILDDPFGAIEVKDNGLLILKNIKELINNLRKDRKLIITTRKDILYKIKESKSLEECSILGVKWLDLTVVKKDEYKKIWSRYFKNNNKSNDLFNEVYNYLNKNENGGFLQPGQIKELFYNKTIDELSTLNISEVIEIARTDSKELAKKIKNKDEDYSKLMIALWLGCNTIESMKLNDLKYLLGESDEKPSLLEEKKNWNGISHSFNRDISIPKFPKYKYNYELNNVYKKGLQYLYDHGYISIENENITFNHPIYNNAGKFLFKKELNTLFNSENNIKLAYRSLGILDKTSVMNTIRILEEIYLEEKNNSIKRLILKGLYSIFPAVKDRVVSFFDSRINELSKEEQENFIDQLFFDENIEGSSILWYKEEPWFNTSNERKFHSYLMNNKLSDTEIIQIKQAVINNELISSKRMWDLLNETNFIFEIKEYEIILKKALKFKEAFIRGKAIYSLFKDYAYNYNKIDKYLDSNEHPNVIYNLFKGMLKSYEKYDNNKKLKIINFIKNNFDNMSVSIKFKKFLENFGDKYNQDIIEWDNYSDKQKVELWEVWYELIIELMIKFPSKHTSMNQPHLDSVMKKSLNFIEDKNKIINIVNAWLDWLDNYNEYKLADDYGMSITDHLLKATGKNSEVRKEVMHRIIMTEKTSFLTSHLRFIIDNWSYLDISERQAIRELISSDREDVVWLKAITITRKNIPAIIQKNLFGELLMEKDPIEIINIIDQKLLEYSLNIYCGYPQPLWWNGYHHCNYDLWDDIIEKVVENKRDKCFKIALRELVILLISDNKDRFKNGYSIWQKINKKADENLRKIIFSRLLYETIDQNDSNKKNLWSQFFKYCNEKEKNNYIEIIIEKIEGVQRCHYDYKGLFEVFDKKFINKEIFPRLNQDGVIIKLCNCFEELHEIGEDLEEKITDILLHYYSDYPPRLFITNIKVLNLLKTIGIKNEGIENLVEINRKRLLDLGSKINEEYNDHYELDNWIY